MHVLVVQVWWDLNFNGRKVNGQCVFLSSLQCGMWITTTTKCIYLWNGWHRCNCHIASQMRVSDLTKFHNTDMGTLELCLCLYTHMHVGIVLEPTIFIKPWSNLSCHIIGSKETTFERTSIRWYSLFWIIILQYYILKFDGYMCRHHLSWKKLRSPCTYMLGLGWFLSNLGYKC